MAAGEQTPSGRAAPAARARSWPGAEVGLSERESQVLLLCAEGLTNREIAAVLFINIETVRTHLKRAYQRLGLHNRAQAAAYVHRHGISQQLVPVDWEVAAESSGPAAGDDHGWDGESLVERRALLGLGHRTRASLVGFGPPAQAGAGAFSRRLTRRWRQLADSAPLVVDDRVVARLVEDQMAYVDRLFTGGYDADHEQVMRGVGATLHGLRLAPQWYLASCAHLVCDHIGVLFDRSVDDQTAMAALVALLASALYDATLVLDSYGMMAGPGAAPADPSPLPSSDLRSHGPPSNDLPSHGEPAADPAPTGPIRSGARTPDVERRRRFVGLGPAEIERLHAMAPLIVDGVPILVADFCREIGHREGTAVLMSPEATDRLAEKLGRYWMELAASPFDDAYADSRFETGAVMERLGVSPQLYLAGLARQVAALIVTVAATRLERGADRREVMADLDVLIRAALFDATFVLDAYMAARAEVVLQVDGLAIPVMTALAYGVVVIDGGDRVDFVNQELLDLVGTTAAVFHRLPIVHALPLTGIAQQVAQARQCASGRIVGLYLAWGRQLRVTALRLPPAAEGPEGRVAIVVDDVSDLLRVNPIGTSGGPSGDPDPDPDDGADREQVTDILLAATRGPARVVVEPGAERLDDVFTVRLVTPGHLWLLGLREPLAVPAGVTRLARPGWNLRATLARSGGHWVVVEIDRIDP